MFKKTQQDWNKEVFDAVMASDLRRLRRAIAKASDVDARVNKYGTATDNAVAKGFVEGAKALLAAGSKGGFGGACHLLCGGYFSTVFSAADSFSILEAVAPPSWANRTDGHGRQLINLAACVKEGNAPPFPKKLLPSSGLDPRLYMLLRAANNKHTHEYTKMRLDWLNNQLSSTKLAIRHDGENIVGELVRVLGAEALPYAEPFIGQLSDSEMYALLHTPTLPNNMMTSILARLMVRVFPSSAVLQHFNDDGISVFMRVCMREGALLDELINSFGADAPSTFTRTLVNSANLVTEMTPLMYAAQAGKFNNVKALLRRGAEVNARDAHGLTAMDYAQRGKFAIAMSVLQSAGGKTRKQLNREANAAASAA